MRGGFAMQTKIIAVFAAAMLTLQAVLPITADAASGNDVRHLVKTLTTNGTMTKADDFNGDGIVNAIDLTLMKRAVLAEANADTGEVRDQTVTAITEQTKLIGRTVTKEGVTWLVHSGSAVECTVTGVAASVTIEGDGNVRSDAKYRPRYGVYVDGELIKDVVMGESEQVVELFSGTAKRTATVKVMHLSEANNGAIGVKQFDVKSSAAKPVQPTAKKDLTIEFVGDSITCAYGVGADSQYVGFETATEDFSKSYAYLTAQLLDADYSAVSYSGYGIVSGYTSDGSKNEDSLVPPVYENVAKTSDYAVPWDFASHPVDAVFVNLGTNDDSYASKELETRAKEYQTKYLAFLKQIRKCNPDAAIICTLGIMGCQELYPYLEAAVKEFNDPKTSCYESPTHNITQDGIGADWHPSPITHEKNSYLAADHICKALGIPYSGVGLDFAADGEYGCDFDKSNGADGWPYFSDWNKSLNINISSGGKSPEEILGYVRNLNLTKGSYTLTFSVKGGEKAEIPYAVRSMKDPKVVYFEGVCKDGKASEAFTMKADASDCEIVFPVGAVGGLNLTFENITLYKNAG